jgi:hypothetical protein
MPSLVQQARATIQDLASPLPSQDLNQLPLQSDGIQAQSDTKLEHPCDASVSAAAPAQVDFHNPVPAPIPDDDGVEADVCAGTKPKFEKMKLRENRRKTFIAEAFIEDDVELPPISAPSKPSAVTTDRRRRAMQSMPLSMPVNFGPLDISVLKKYKKCFKVPAKANACKEELLSVIAKHFLQLKVDEAKTVKSCIKKVRRMHKLADI